MHRHTIAKLEKALREMSPYAGYDVHLDFYEVSTFLAYIKSQEVYIKSLEHSLEVGFGKMKDGEEG